MDFIFGIIYAIDGFFSVIIHNLEQIFFQKKLRQTWLDAMGDISKLEAILNHQVNIMEAVIEAGEQREELGMIDSEDEEYLAQKDHVKEVNQESLKFFQGKLASIQKIKNDLLVVMKT